MKLHFRQRENVDREKRTKMNGGTEMGDSKRQRYLSADSCLPFEAQPAPGRSSCFSHTPRRQLFSHEQLCCKTGKKKRGERREGGNKAGCERGGGGRERVEEEEKRLICDEGIQEVCCK